MNKRMWFWAIAIMFSLSGRGELTADERLMLEQAFAETNIPSEVFAKVYPPFPNNKVYMTYANPKYSRELWYNILTNMCRFKSGDIWYWRRNSMISRNRLFSMQCSYRCEANDLQYLELCADFLGNEMITIDFRSDIPPRDVVYYNGEVQDNRMMMLKRFRRLVERFEKTLGEEEISGFRSNIIHRAKLTDQEKAVVFHTCSE